MSTTPNTSSGIGFVGLLTILFIGLKLGGVIAWSWFWILSPILLSSGLGIFLIVVIAIIGLLTSDA